MFDLNIYETLFSMGLLSICVWAVRRVALAAHEDAEQARCAPITSTVLSQAWVDRVTNVVFDDEPSVVGAGPNVAAPLPSRAAQSTRERIDEGGC